MNAFEAEVAIEPQSISHLGEDVHEFLLAAGVDARASHHVALILDEILTNVIMHGGAAEETAAIRIDVDAEHVRGEIRDPGRHFDPRGGIDAQPRGAISEREVGGLGLHLVRKVTSELDYSRDGDRNCTRFAVPRIRNHSG
jgi:serine/threonine-protein kinase RsbW